MKTQKTAYIPQAAALILAASMILSSCDRQLADLIAISSDTDSPSQTEAAQTEAVPTETSPSETDAAQTAAADETSDNPEDPPPVPPAAPGEAGSDETAPAEAPAPAIALTTLPVIGPTGIGYNCAHRFVFNQSYHNFTDIDRLIDKGEFEEWRQVPANKTDDCDYADKNIYEIIQYFEIPRDDFERWYYSTMNYYLYDFDIDILYSSDAGTVETFYRSSGNYGDMMNRYGLLRIKIELENLVGREKYAAYLGVNTNDAEAMAFGLANRECEWSIADFAAYFALTEEQYISAVQAYVDEIAGREVALNQYTSDGGRFILPDTEFSAFGYPDIFSRVNLDILFAAEPSEDVTAAIESGEYPVLIDEMICSGFGAG